MVICNLQKTPRDRKADLLIHTYVDDILHGVMAELGLVFPVYNTLCRFKIWVTDGAQGAGEHGGVVTNAGRKDSAPSKVTAPLAPVVVGASPAPIRETGTRPHFSFGGALEASTLRGEAQVSGVTAPAVNRLFRRYAAGLVGNVADCGRISLL